ncbi:ABC transporter permease subunit [Pseudorhodoferax sp.]|uniref:ABC transporter permease subunit n=1 Tax=Pseudorhodoferax sp. TaxID=1993553 RepID=UPI0039E4D55D
MREPRSAVPAALWVLLALALAGAALWLLRGAAPLSPLWGWLQAQFGFLAQPAGFGISEGWLDFDSGQSYARAFAMGVLNTVRAAVPAALLAVGLGTLLGIGRLAPHLLVRAVCTAYVEALRNVPLLVQLLMLYFALTHLLPDSSAPVELLPGCWLSKNGLSLPWPVWEGGAWPARLEWPETTAFGVAGGAALSPEYLAIVFGLGLYSAAFVAEIVRAGVQSVPAGQKLAAQALGLTGGQQLRLVVLPQALRVIVPALTNQLLSLTKNSSLAVAVGYPELVSVANTSLNATGKAFECIAIVMAVYLLLSLAISAAMNVYNARVALRGWR